MGNCRSILQPNEPSRQEAGRGNTEVPREGFLQGLCRGLRRRRAEVGVTCSSSADSPGYMEGHTTAAVPPLPMGKIMSASREYLSSG